MTACARALLHLTCLSEPNQRAPNRIFFSFRRTRDTYDTIRPLGRPGERATSAATEPEVTVKLISGTYFWFRDLYFSRTPSHFLLGFQHTKWSWSIASSLPKLAPRYSSAGTAAVQLYWAVSSCRAADKIFFFCLKLNPRSLIPFGAYFTGYVRWWSCLRRPTLSRDRVRPGLRGCTIKLALRLHYCRQNAMWIVQVMSWIPWVVYGNRMASFMQLRIKKVHYCAVLLYGLQNLLANKRRRSISTLSNNIDANILSCKENS